jgi:uncharacterized protein YndB with AHSA1/START domain
MSNNTIVLAKEGNQNIEVIRIFEAPIHLVFSAFTEQEIYKKWFLPPEMNSDFEVFEAKSGGSYYISHNNEIGEKFAFQGVYHEINGPNLIVKTAEYHGLPQKVGATLEIYKFEALDSETTQLKIQIICPSENHRNGMVEAGMQNIFDKTHAALDTILNEMSNEN